MFADQSLLEVYPEGFFCLFVHLFALCVCLDLYLTCKEEKEYSIILSVKFKYFFSGHFAESACFLLKIITFHV